MGAFQTGFQLGGDAFNSAVKAKLMEDQLAMEQAREARAAEEFNWRRDQQAREEAAFNRYNNLAGGIDTNTQKQLADTYGMNPAQVASALQAGGVEGLKARVAGYDVPDASDLQSRPDLARDEATGTISPVAGLRPRMSADQLSMTEPTRLAKEKAMEQLAIARRDVQGLRASQQAQLDLQKNDIASEVMKMKTSELDELAPQVSKSGYPLLYTGKSKNGYTFLKTENDGVTPIPGSEFKMTESQLRQMALAHKLGEAGFGTDALETLNKAHKDLGEHVARWNDTMTKVATVGNTATHYGNQDANAAAHTAAVSKYYSDKTGLDRMGAAQYFTGEDGSTYASIPTMTKNGLKFETVKVNPEGIALKRMGGAGDGKPQKIEEEGTKMLVGGKPVIADGNGNWIPADGAGRPQGVLPSERTKVLKDAGVPDNLIGQLPWNKTGTGVMFNGKEYDPKDRKDLKLLTDTYKRLGAAGIAMEEATANDIALQERNRRRGGLAPSPYAPSEDWQLYRNQERNLGLIPNLGLNRNDVP